METSAPPAKRGATPPSGRLVEAGPAHSAGPTVSPLLDPAGERLALFDGDTGGPKYPATYALFKKLQGLHWVTDEHADILREDQVQWPALPRPLRRFARHFLAFFLYGDELVIRNLTENVMGVVTMPEALAFFREQAAQEVTHAEAYALQVFAVMGAEEAGALEKEALGWPEIAALAGWASAWMSPAAGFWHRLLAFACFEGVVFSSAFAALQSFREINVLPGITTFNEFIARDEGAHADFAIHLLNEYAGAALPSPADAHAIVAGAVNGAVALAAAALRKDGPEPSGAPGYSNLPGGVTFDRLADYVRHTANVLLHQLGYAPLYRQVTRNPLPFMEKMALNAVAKTNFFEFRPTQYRGAQAETFEWGETDEAPIRV